MKIARLALLALAVVGLQGLADETRTAQPRFAAPVRIMAGEAFLGAGRYYPSPVLHDVDGDKQLDIVVGDLFGKVTYARRISATKFAAEQPLQDRDGKPLKFHNW